MARFTASAAMVAAFQRDGFFIADQLLDGEEVSLLRQIARADREMNENRARRADGEGGAVELVVKNELPEDSIYGAIVRSRRIVRTMETLLGDEVYHYHHKMICKEPRTGGAWAWHQDYGYWYNNGCLLPKLGSCLIGVDRATRENGCLQVLRGSHHIGRIDHGPIGEQTGADPERVRNELSQEGVIAEEWGGENIFVPVSARTGDGIDKLLESILLQAEVLELKAVQDAPAIGVVLEASVERGRGAEADALVG